MSRLDSLKAKVDSLYGAKNKSRAVWADWLYANHVFAVAENAGKFCDRFGGNSELATAAGMLHDIADAVMQRENPAHGEESVNIASGLLAGAGYTEDEKDIIIGDAIRFHGCHGVDVPKTPEGKALASADAYVHLTTDFYDYAIKTLRQEMTDEQIKKWALPKLDRDLNAKIFYEEIREEVRPRYELLKMRFSVSGKL